MQNRSQNRSIPNTPAHARHRIQALESENRNIHGQNAYLNRQNALQAATNADIRLANQSLHQGNQALRHNLRQANAEVATLREVSRKLSRDLYTMQHTTSQDLEMVAGLLSLRSAPRGADAASAHGQAGGGQRGSSTPQVAVPGSGTTTASSPALASGRPTNSQTTQPAVGPPRGDLTQRRRSLRLRANNDAPPDDTPDRTVSEAAEDVGSNLDRDPMDTSDGSCDLAETEDDEYDPSDDDEPGTAAAPSSRSTTTAGRLPAQEAAQATNRKHAAPDEEADAASDDEEEHPRKKRRYSRPRDTSVRQATGTLESGPVGFTNFQYPSTVRGVFEVWYDGTRGNPPLGRLEAEHGSRWRNSPGEIKYWSNYVATRKVVVDCVEQYAAQQGEAVDSVIDRLGEFVDGKIHQVLLPLLPKGKGAHRELPDPFPALLEMRERQRDERQ